MPRAPRQVQVKHWIFVINNPTIDDVNNFHVYREAIKYVIFNREVGDQGTPHLQGYIVMKVKKRLSQMKALMPTAHLEAKQGSVEQARHYCMKPVPECMCEHCVKARPQVAAYSEYGDIPVEAVEAMRNKWDEYYESAKSGDLEDIPKKVLLRFYAAFKRIVQDNPEKPRDMEELDNLWVVAPTRYGKSRYVREKFPDYYDKAPNKWFTGYKGQETILLDDLGPKQCEYLTWYIKRWADLYSFPMETKGGGRQIRPRRIVVTSQYTIRECFADDRQADAVAERFTVLELRHWRVRRVEEVQLAHGIVRFTVDPLDVYEGNL